MRKILFVVILALVLLAIEALAFQAAFAADQNETSSASSLIFTPEDIIRLVTFIFLFLGILCRTVLPYVTKLKENGGNLIWNHKYTLTAISTLFIAFVTTMLAMPQLQIPTSIVSLFGIAIFTFGYGWGLNDLINQVSSVSKTPNQPSSTEPPPATSTPSPSPVSEWVTTQEATDLKIEVNSKGEARITLSSPKYIGGEQYPAGYQSPIFPTIDAARAWLYGKS